MYLCLIHIEVKIFNDWLEIATLRSTSPESKVGFLTCLVQAK